jgi:hypothetical protein
MKAGRDAWGQCVVVPEDLVAPRKQNRGEALEERIKGKEFDHVFGPVTVEGELPGSQRFCQDASRWHGWWSTDFSPFEALTQVLYGTSSPFMLTVTDVLRRRKA